MKKNKKYWKKQAKKWEKIAGIESESANEWSYTAITQADQIDELEQELYTVHMDLQIESMLLDEAKDNYAELDKQYIETIEKTEAQAIAFEATRRELSVLRQYNIGKKNITYNSSQSWIGKYNPDAKPTTGTSTKDWTRWAIKEYNIPTGMDEKSKKAVEDAYTSRENKIIRWWKNNN